MKKLLVFLLVLFLSFGLFSLNEVYAGNKNLIFFWEQTLPDPNDLGGWKLYSSQTLGGPYILFVTIPFVSAQTEYTSIQIFTSPDGQRKTWYFVLTAFDTAVNESAYSNEAFTTIDFESPGIPIQFKVIVTPVP